ncbi:hypothetical protein CPC08DRAFT_714759 [Agrocybe pediades]|nr:hypothetical protein CPC08DRAFT_714759 [Agrocybe pediades]
MTKTYTGKCYCGEVKWKIELSDPKEGRTSLCHCLNCKKFFGTEYGITTKVPWNSFSLFPDSKQPKKHVSSNEGRVLTREFCETCGSPIREWGGAAEGHFTYVCYGGLDDEGRKELPPTAEFWLRRREEWCRDILGDDVYRQEELPKAPFAHSQT